MKDLKQIIAENIIELRKRHKMTQAELAEELNYTDKAVSKWERGESIPDIQTLKELASKFGVTVDYILNENSDEEKEKYLMPEKTKYNKLAITLLFVVMVWFVATLFYVYAVIYKFEYANLWVVFIFCIPASAVLLLIFNFKWGRRKYAFIINTVLNWSTLLSIFLASLSYVKMWPIFFVGIPLQIIIFLWSQIRKE